MKYYRLSFGLGALAGGCLLPQMALSGSGPIVSINGQEMSASNETISTSISAEYVVESAYIGDGEVTRGKGPETGNFSEAHNLVRFVFTPDVKLGILRLGAEWERYEFDFDFPRRNAPLPERLHSVAGIIGLDTQISDSILMRIEAQPGVYSTVLEEGEGSFSVPVIIGGTYIYSSSLQLVLGVSIDYERESPALPGGGVRWKIGPQWVLNAVLPTPRLEYSPSNNVTIYGGANLKQKTYRVQEDLFYNRENWNHALVTYTEVRIGGGVDWDISSFLTLTVEGGYQPFRTFDFHRLDVRYKQDEGAPYAMISLHGAF